MPKSLSIDKVLYQVLAAQILKRSSDPLALMFSRLTHSGGFVKTFYSSNVPTVELQFIPTGFHFCVTC